MRSARMLMATAAASAVLALGAPGAYASGGWDTTDSSYSKEHDKGQDNTAKPDESSRTAKQDSGSWSGKQDSGSESGKQDEESWGGTHEKPSGGVHTGGGGLTAPTVTAGGLAVLAVAATGLFAARRKKTAGSVA